MAKKSATNIRAIAAELLQQIHTEQQTIHTLLPPRIQQLKQASSLGSNSSSQTAFLQALCYGSCRWFYRLEAILDHCLSKPIRNKDRSVYYLLIIGLYQLEYLDKPEYAIVKETVDALKAINKTWAKGLVNGILRRFIREKESITEEIDKKTKHSYSYAQSAHPAWLLKNIKNDWSSLAKVEEILTANNQHPPLWLRINQSKFDKPQDYLQRLKEQNIECTYQEKYSWSVIIDKPLDVNELPGFLQGDVSVQDASPQQSAFLLSPKSNDKVLDVCSAPGGKTAHLLELQTPEILLALDNKQHRLDRVSENLKRLNLKAQLKCADALELDSWWDGTLYDKILLDVPCSATGVIRRNPDIKLTRSEQEVELLISQQSDFLTKIWPCLKPGGTLLYATCSILRQENDQQIEKFLAQQNDAIEISIELPTGHALNHGWQILPGEDNMDGFYYAKLVKSNQ